MHERGQLCQDQETEFALIRESLVVSRVNHIPRVHGHSRKSSMTSGLRLHCDCSKAVTIDNNTQQHTTTTHKQNTNNTQATNKKTNTQPTNNTQPANQANQATNLPTNQPNKQTNKQQSTKQPTDNRRKHGAQGAQTGWAVAQINEATHELVCSVHGAMPISLPVQRRIMRAELWASLQSIILSEPGATFISDCAAVLRGLERGQKWCSAARTPHADVWRRIWERFRDIGEEAHIDSVTKCKAHLCKAEQAKLDDAIATGKRAGRRAG